MRCLMASSVFSLPAGSLAQADELSGLIDSPGQLLRGERAAGRMGDLRLSDEDSVFIFSALDHGVNRHAFGGVLIDLALPDPALDRLGELQTGIGPRLSRRVRNTGIGLSEDGQAMIVEGEDRQNEAITFRTEYRLDSDWSALVVTTVLTNGTEASLEGWGIGDVVHWGSSAVFVMDAGMHFFQGQQVSGRAVFGFGPDFSVAITPGEGKTVELVAHRDGTRLIHAQGDVAPGETMTCTRHLIVGTESMHTVAEPLWAILGAETGTLRGEVIEQGTGVKVAGAEVLINERGERASPLLRVLTDEQGQFSVALPSGIRLFPIARSYSRTRPTQTAPPIQLEPGGEAYCQSLLSPPALLDLRVVDDDTGELIPVRVALYTLQDRAVALGPVQSGEVGGPYIFAVDGEGVFEVPTGQFRMTISRGIEYTRHEQQVIFMASRTRQFHLSLERVVDTSGYVAADLGVLTNRSHRAVISPVDRLRTAVTEGLEFLVATDSEHVTDLAAALETSGLDLPVTVARGERILPSEDSPVGSWSVFPLPEEHTGHSAFVGETFESHRDLLQTIRAQFPQALISCLAPARAGQSPFPEMGYHLNLATRNWESATPADAEDVDFDLMEVFGDRDLNHKRDDLGLWHGLLREGHRITAVASANSHYAGVEEIGYPRTLIAAEDSDPRAIDPDEVWASLRAGNAVVTSGPWIEFSIRGHQMGEMFPWEMDEPVRVNYRVISPSWIPLANVEICKEGLFVQRMTLPGGEGTMGAVRVWTPPEGRDRFMVRHDQIFTIEVKGARHLRPMNPANGFPEAFVPLAVSNPIWVDTDGNGRFDIFSYEPASGADE
jgi:hypothetical protein